MKFRSFLGLLICLSSPLAADDSPVQLQITGRCEKPGETAGRITADYRKLSAGLVAVREKDGGYSFSGGLALPWAALGSLTVRGPLQELIKPGAQTASSAKYSDAPSFSLQRSWSPASREALVLGLPGIIQFSMLEGEGKLPELGIEAEFAPFPWLRLAGVGSYSKIPEDTDDEWIQKEGVPVEGELLLGGIRLILKGEHAGLSCFAGASLHRVQPAGGYLRGSLLYDSSFLNTRFALSFLDRNYRSPRNLLSPYKLSSAFDLLILPVYPVKGLVRSSARLDHPPLCGTEPADLRFSLEGGAAWVFTAFSGEITRDLLVKRDEGLYTWEESMSGNLAFSLPGIFAAWRTRLYAGGSYLISYDVLEEATAGFSLRRLPLDLSFSSGISREKEACEPPEESFLFMKADLALIFDDWETGAGFSMGESGFSLSISGGRSFRFGGM
ncbi:hypothetical protein [Marispirochaeta aestuarii]|uniref:hypothetical protein n=1 Tax=Marispirochaeta aestuarii TaxID=1963862 RepID=UPI002ABDE1C1|nr:hypothetical protein [Marispirochaeta aestuarii]